MSTEDTDLLDEDEDEFGETEPAQQTQDTNLIKRLRKQAEKGTAWKNRVSELETEIAIRDAGLTLSPEQRKAVLAVHDGPKTADAIAETAKVLGWGPPPAQDTPDEAAEKGIDAATKSAQTLLAGDSGDDLTPRQAQSKYESGAWDYPTYMAWMQKKHGSK